MISQLPGKEIAKVVAMCILVLGVFVFVGVTKSKSAPSITFENLEPNSAPIPKPSAVDKPASLLVQVKGAVRKPGVYRLKADARVHDAIREAGGAKPHADLSEWNLAAKLQDGASIYVMGKQAVQEQAAKKVASNPRPRGLTGSLAPMQVEVPEEYRGGPHSLAPFGSTKVEPEANSTSRSSSGKKAVPAEASVSLNTGTQADLENLPGVGPATAQKIIEYRRENGGFTSIEELLAVKGIGPKKMEAMRKYLKL